MISETLAPAPQGAGAGAILPKPIFALTFSRFLLLGVAHALVGLVLPYGSLAVTALASIAVLLTMREAWVRPSSAPYSAVYIAGSELIWRMTAAHIPWELAKYAAAGVLFVAAWRRGLRPNLTGGLAVSYLVLLLPSAALTLSSLPLHDARTRLAFNLSGPALLAIGIWVLSSWPLREIRPVRLLAFFVLPIFAACARIVRFTLDATEIIFEGEASFITSGGYGPNQVSSILGAAVLVLVFMAAQTRVRWQQFVLYVLAALIFFQGVLTFSRGGVFACLMGILALAVHLLMKPNQAPRFFIAIAVLGLVLSLFVLPRTDDWTGGELFKRYTNFDGAGRRDIAEQDFEIFFHHPVIGVGPGLAPHYRSPDLVGYASHTEFSRTLSEHGALGLLALIMLAVCTVRTYLRAGSLGGRAWVAAFVTWGAANALTASMRLSSAALLFALAFLDFHQLGDRDP